MFDPSVPEDDETLRLQVLLSYKLLDNGPAPAYDDIANIASLMCGTPIAMVSVIDSDRQWSKARVGMEQAQTPRDQAFCSHAICNPTSIMEVPNASKAPRFMFNPLVIGDSGIRFYAGAPLLSP